MRRVGLSIMALACAGAFAASCKSNVIESNTNINNDSDGGASDIGDASASIGDAASALDAMASAPSLSAKAARLVVGQSATVEIDLASALATAVDLTFTGLPAGVTIAAASASIAPGATSATITMNAASDASEGHFAVVVHGTGAAEGSLDLVVAAASGALDKSFNGSGVYFDPPPVDAGDGGDAGAVAIMSDDRILIAGGRSSQPWTLFRLNADGTRDKPFDALLADNTKGALFPSNGGIVDVIVAADGQHIYVYGTQVNAAQSPNPVPTVIALNADGSRVTSFGTNGVWSLDMSNGYLKGVTASAIAADPGGGVYVSWLRNGTSATEIRRLDGTGGKSFAQYAPAAIRALAASAHGVYAAGEALDDAGTPHFLYAAHLDPSGAADPAFPGVFGGDGGLTFPQGTLAVGDGVLDDAGAFTIVAGYGGNGGFGPPLMARIGADGGLLLGGGGATQVQGSFPQHNAGFGHASGQADGKVVAIGWGFTSQAQIPYLARLGPSGALDPSFAGGGVRDYVVPNNTSSSATYVDVAVDSIGRIVVLGNQSPQGWLVQRLWP